VRRRAAAALALIAVSAVARASGAAEPKRAQPDYDGRGGEPTTAGDVALWIPRVLLSPLYFVSEYLIRRPIGALIAGAERAGVPGLLYDFFLFGPNHRGGIFPVAFIDFGFEPSVGVYTFWNDAFVRGHDLSLHATTWGSDWIAATFADRVHLSSDPADLAVVEASGVRRPDYTFFGLGPSSRQSDLVRYGSDSLEARTGVDQHLWRSSSFRARVGVRSVDFRRGGLGSDPVLQDTVAAGSMPEPPGVARGYTVGTSSLAVAVDSRRPDAESGSGLRLALEGAYAGDVRETGGWVTYGGAAGAFLDLNDRQRVVSLSVMARFVDPLGNASVPFTELATLGGSYPMRAFYPGRLYDRSAAVAELAYRWPVWIWLDGAMRFEVGNVFGPDLRGFDPGLLRFSGSIGLEAKGVTSNPLQLLLGVGTETFESGAKVDAFRFVVGTTHGF
jgi:hypothetical protein